MRTITIARVACVRPSLLPIALLVASSSSAAEVAGRTPPAGESLTGALADRISSVIMGWGELGWNTSVKPVDRPAMALRIGETTYERGLGHHAPGEIVVDLLGEFRTFETDIGIQWQGGNTQASVVFQVFVDGKKAFDSGVLRDSDPPKSISIPVDGADELRLVATDAGDGITCDCADWADPRLVRDPGAAARPRLEAGIARYARIVAWDPDRRDGTTASRIQEFPAEDLFPCEPIATAAGPAGSPTRYRVVPWGGKPAGPASFGLWWYENRYLRRVALELADPAKAPDPKSVRIEAWEGESPWQGRWKALDVPPTVRGARWEWTIPPRALANGTPKVRWVVQGVAAPPGALELTSIEAYPQATWRTASVRLEPAPGSTRGDATLEVYNGEILDAAGKVASPRTAWNREAPLDLRVLHTSPRRYKADRTVIQLRVDGTSFAVAVEDLLSREAVWVPHAGIVAMKLPSSVSASAWVASLEGRKTVLERVRELPEQTLARAFEKVHDPLQDHGPTMLSLACDNRKLVAFRDGSLAFEAYERADEEPREMPRTFRLVPRFDATGTATRRLRGGWLPDPETTTEGDGVAFRARAWVAPLGSAPEGGPAWWRDRAVGVLELEAVASGPTASHAALALGIESQSGPAEWRPVGSRLVVERDGRVLAWVEPAGDAALRGRADGSEVRIEGDVPPGATSRWAAFVPAFRVAPDALPALAIEDLRGSFEAYWRGLLDEGIRLDLPDSLLEDIIAASRVHCLLAARNEDGGARVSPWISSDRYGPLESESNSIIRGLSLFGHEDTARRSLEFFLRRISSAGFLTTGYTLIGTGEHLWTLGEHALRYRDDAWLRGHAPEVVRACRWIMAQRAKTRRFGGEEESPESGLSPPGVTADWGRFAWRYFNDAQYATGLELAGRALGAVSDTAAAEILEDAAGYRSDILRAWRWTRARSPVVPLESGAWVPGAPAILDCFGRVEDFLPGEDGNRSWAYSIEIGAHHLAACGILDPASRETGWILDYLEDVQMLRSGMGWYTEEENRKDFFDLGGFGKVQPYYGRVAEVHALRDDVKPFLRSYFNAIPSLLSLENLSFWEHFHNIGGWNKTHETGWFLCQSRLLLVEERGDELWLLPFAPSAWLRAGARISVANAPTRFGAVSFEVASTGDAVEARISPPSRERPKVVVLRLRHPDGKRIREATVDGRKQPGAASADEVRLVPSGAGAEVRVSF